MGLPAYISSLFLNQKKAQKKHNEACSLCHFKFDSDAF